jgi:hypothetical protein
MVGGYLKALDCNEGDTLSVCMGMQIEVGTLVPYDHQWQVVKHPNGKKAGQMSVWARAARHGSLPQDLLLPPARARRIGGARECLETPGQCQAAPGFQRSVRLGTHWR